MTRRARRDDDDDDVGLVGTMGFMDHVRPQTDSMRPTKIVAGHCRDGTGIMVNFTSFLENIDPCRAVLAAFAHPAAIKTYYSSSYLATSYQVEFGNKLAMNVEKFPRKHACTVGDTSRICIDKRGWGMSLSKQSLCYLETINRLSFVLVRILIILDKRYSLDHDRY